jgi:large subunit ribosomal protein L20
MPSKAKILRLATGFRGRANNCIRIARERVEKSLQYAYRDRKNKKRDMRRLWITRINAGSREHGVRYSDLIRGLGEQRVAVNRKMLSELAVNEPYSFKALVDQVKYMRGGG